MATVGREKTKTKRPGRDLKPKHGQRMLEGSKPPSQDRSVAGRLRATVDTSEYSGKIAARVRTLRETLGMSVEELAKKSGIDVKAFYAYEQRTRRIPAEKYPAIAKALGCKTPDEFFPPLK